MTVPLTIIVSIYLVGVAAAFYYLGRDRSRLSRLWTATAWPLFAALLFGAFCASVWVSFADIHESRTWYKRSWPRIIRDYPVCGRIYKFVTRGKE